MKYWSEWTDEEIEEMHEEIGRAFAKAIKDYDYNYDMESPYPWCCPETWTDNDYLTKGVYASITTIEDFVKTFVEEKKCELEKLIKEDKECKQLEEEKNEEDKK